MTRLPASEGHDYAVRLCDPVPDKTWSKCWYLRKQLLAIVSAEHHIVAMSSTTVGFYFPWGSKYKSQNRNDTALVLVNRHP